MPVFGHDGGILRVTRHEKRGPNNTGEAADIFAEKLGFVAGDSVGHIECGRSKPSLQTLIRVAQICGVSMDYLTGLVDAPHLNVASAVAEREELSPAQTQLLRDIAQSMVPFVKQIKE